MGVLLCQHTAMEIREQFVGSIFFYYVVSGGSTEVVSLGSIGL